MNSDYSTLLKGQIMSREHNNDPTYLTYDGGMPTKERHYQNGGVTFDVIDHDHKILVKRYRAVWECPLDAYMEQGAISPYFSKYEVH